MPFIADRNLYLDVTKTKVLEEGDPAARFVLAGPGSTVDPDEVKRLKMGKRHGYWTGEGAPEEPVVEAAKPHPVVLAPLPKAEAPKPAPVAAEPVKPSTPVNQPTANKPGPSLKK